MKDPWNAKFGLFGSQLPKIKYPGHYVPELLMTALSIAGAATWAGLRK